MVQHWLEMLSRVRVTSLINDTFGISTCTAPEFWAPLWHSELIFSALIPDLEAMIQELKASPFLDIFGQEFTPGNARQFMPHSVSLPEEEPTHPPEIQIFINHFAGDKSLELFTMYSWDAWDGEWNHGIPEWVGWEGP